MNVGCVPMSAFDAARLGCILGLFRAYIGLLQKHVTNTILVQCVCCFL